MVLMARNAERDRVPLHARAKRRGGAAFSGTEESALFQTAAAGSGSGAHLFVEELPAQRHSGRLRHSHLRLLGREVPTSLLILAIFEALVLVAAFHLAVQIRFPDGALDVSGFSTGLDAKVILFAAVNMVAMLCMGLYRRGLPGTSVDVALRVFGAFLLGAALLAALFYLLPALFFGRGVLFFAVLLAFGGVMTIRLAGIRLLDLDALKRRVLVLGAGRVASRCAQFRKKGGHRNFELVGFAPSVNETHAEETLPLLVLDRPLHRYAREHRIDDVVVALDDPRGGFPVEELIACKMNGISVLEITDFFERECGFLKLDILRPSAMIFCPGFRQSLYRDYAKRALDLLAASVLLLLVWPFMLLTALGIVAEGRGRGDVLFRQKRVGQNGRPFTLYKFRSMVPDAEADGVARWAQPRDPRITRFGRFIRKTRLDELPQLFNVLGGHMSFVGPRPERPEFVEGLCASLPYYTHRHWVKPGLTGWAQINYPYGASEEEAFKKLEYDLYYVKNQRITLDLLIIAQTVEVVLWGQGAR